MCFRRMSTDYHISCTVVGFIYLHECMLVLVLLDCSTWSVVWKDWPGLCEKQFWFFDALCTFFLTSLLWWMNWFPAWHHYLWNYSASSSQPPAISIMLSAKASESSCCWQDNHHTGWWPSGEWGSNSLLPRSRFQGRPSELSHFRIGPASVIGPKMGPIALASPKYFWNFCYWTLIAVCVQIVLCIYISFVII